MTDVNDFKSEIKKLKYENNWLKRHLEKTSKELTETSKEKEQLMKEYCELEQYVKILVGDCLAKNKKIEDLLKNESKTTGMVEIKPDEDENLEEFYPTYDALQCEICQSIKKTKQEFLEHLNEKHSGMIDEEVLVTLKSDILKNQKKSALEIKYVSNETLISTAPLSNSLSTTSGLEIGNSDNIIDELQSAPETDSTDAEQENIIPNEAIPDIHTKTMAVLEAEVILAAVAAMSSDNIIDELQLAPETDSTNAEQENMANPSTSPNATQVLPSSPEHSKVISQPRINCLPDVENEPKTKEHPIQDLPDKKSPENICSSQIYSEANEAIAQVVDELNQRQTCKLTPEESLKCQKDNRDSNETFDKVIMDSSTSDVTDINNLIANLQPDWNNMETLGYIDINTVPDIVQKNNVVAKVEVIQTKTKKKVKSSKKSGKAEYKCDQCLSLIHI